MMGTSWVFTAVGLTGLMTPSVAVFTTAPSEPDDSTEVFNDTTPQETSANTSTLSSLANSSSYATPTTSDAGSSVDREQAPAHEDENSRLWLGVGLGAGAMAGVVLVVVLVMVVVWWARRRRLSCGGKTETESPPAESPPAASTRAAAAASPADGQNYEGLQSRPEGDPTGEVYEAISDSPGNTDVYENSDTVQTPTAHAPGGSKQSQNWGPKGNGTQEKKVEGGDMYVNYTPSLPSRPPRHENLKHVQAAFSPPPVPLSPPPRHPNPSVYTNAEDCRADEGDLSDDDYVDMKGPAAASMTRKTKM